MGLTVALIAEEATGARALRLLVDRGHRVVAVFSDAARGGIGESVGELAAGLEIPVRPAAEVRDQALGADLRALELDLLVNVHSLHIVNPEVLGAPTLGSYNLHPGPLPECAGLNAPGWALYEGRRYHGVTLHRMTAGIDEGPIVFVERFEIGARTTALVLMTECARRGLRLLERLLELAETGTPIPAERQDLSRRRWFSGGPPEGGSLDWDRPASRVVDFVHACDYGPFPSPWGFPRCVAACGEVAISAAEAMADRTHAEPGTVQVDGNRGVLVAAADAWVRVDRVELNSERVSAAKALRSGERLGPAEAACRARVDG